MAPRITHQFQSSRPNSANPELVSSNAWNQEHALEDVASATDLNSLEEAVTQLESDVDAALALKADKAITISSGAGLEGGGDLSANRTLALKPYDALDDLPFTALDGRADKLSVWDESAGVHKGFFIPQLVVDVTHPTFGAEGDGTTDDSGPIQAAIDYVKSLGGGIVWFPALVFLVSSTLVVNESNITLAGPGGGSYKSGLTNTRNSCAARILFSASATPAAVCEFTSVAGADPKAGGGTKNIAFDGNDRATQCLVISSWAGGKFEYTTLIAATQEHLLTRAFAGTLANAPYDVTNNVFEHLVTTAVNVTGNTAYGARLTGGQGNGAATSGNTSLNTFKSCFFGSWNAPSLYLEDADSNYFFGCITRPETGGGTNYSAVLNSSDQNSSGNSDLGYARYNQFFGCEFAKGVYSRASQIGGNSAHSNTFYGYSRGNAATGFVQELGAGGADDATVQVFSTEAAETLKAVKAAVSDSLSNIDSVAAALGTSSLRVSNSASNHVRLVHSTSSAEWAVNIDGTLGNLRIQRLAGTGLLGLIDSVTAFQDNGDLTKQVQLQLSGLTTGITRTLAVPDASGTLPLLGLAQTWSAKQTFTQVMGLSALTAIPGAAAASTYDEYVDDTGRKWRIDSGGRLIHVGSPSHARQSTTLASASTSTTINVQGASAPTADGTATGVAIASTNRYTRTVRIRSVSAASTGANTGHRIGDFRYLSDAGLVSIVFGWEGFQANAAAFIGIKTTGAHGDVDPSSFTSCIGVGIDSGQTTWRLLHNDGSGSAVATDLGANFPANTDATDIYELILWWSASATAVYYQLVRLNTGHVASGKITSELPGSTAALNAHIIANTRSGSAALDIAWSRVFGETI